jgi:ketosteroid isomerase-like protein
MVLPAKIQHCHYSSFIGQFLPFAPGCFLPAKSEQKVSSFWPGERHCSQLHSFMGQEIKLQNTRQTPESTFTQESRKETTRMSNLDLARKALHASEGGDIATLSSMVTDDFQFLGVTPQALGKQEFLGFIQAMTTAFPDFKFNETTASESGDTVTIKHKISGTHTGTFNVPGMPPIPATGKKFALPEEASVFTFQGGKATKYTAQPAPDGGLPGILKQLGVPMPH